MEVKMLRMSMGWLVVVASGCAEGAGMFRHQSQVETPSHGVALVGDSSEAHVGMFGNTCSVDTTSGIIGADGDIAVGEDDNVQDAFGHEVVVVGSDGAYVVDRELPLWGESGVTMGGVSQARLSEAGLVGLRSDAGSCSVAWATGSVVVAETACGEAAMDTVRDSGTALVGFADRLVVASEAGISVIGQASSLLAWDSSVELAYVAALGGSSVAAVDLTGAVRWQVDVPGIVRAVDDMGPSGAVAVMVELEDGSGELEVLDGASGAPSASLATPSAASAVAVGNNGSTMAFVLPNEVHFFAVDLGAE